MVAGSFTVEVESSVEPKRLWNATVNDSHNLLPKQAPGIIAAVTILQGDGGVGTIRQVDFTPANKDFSYVKERVDQVDEDNLVFSFSHVEGGVLGTKLASANHHMKFSPKAGGGSIATFTVSYDSLPGVLLDESKLQEFKANSIGLFRLVEQYLLANPTLYL
ncbi:hypothetical protein SUGI_0963000 [Cryptomeria japonica]|uniref:major allergen Pru ar 1 n=1 Tax=Cryptomeria japonica TaxID=3369 RepID=UPI002414CA2D|nr:major allergen Pru ar 1 [Cryptomeria japonica]GLJ45763.1 hypothetical protein SUGI_0963000 [Cryptomeria japonica]